MIAGDLAANQLRIDGAPDVMNRSVSQYPRYTSLGIDLQKHYVRHEAVSHGGIYPVFGINAITGATG